MQKFTGLIVGYFMAYNFNIWWVGAYMGMGGYWKEYGIPGGTRIIFWRGVRPEVWNPYPYLRIFLPQKTADLKLFFEIFANRDPFLRVFLPQNGWFYNLFAIFAKWDPLLRIFLSKMGPMSKDFCWKSNPFGRHIPVCLNMWVPPPPGYGIQIQTGDFQLAQR